MDDPLASSTARLREGVPATATVASPESLRHEQPTGPRSLVACGWFSGWGGREHWTAQLLAALQTRGHRVVYYCHPAQAALAREAGIPFEHYPLRGDAVLTDALRMAAALRRRRPDSLLIAHESKIWLAWMAARAAGVQRVVTRTALSSYRARKLKYRIALTRWVDAVVCNAQAMTDAYQEDLAGHVRAPTLLTIWDGVEPKPPRSPPGALRAELAIPDGALVIGMVARLDRRKRIDLALAAFAQLPQHVHLLIAGDGTLRDELPRLAAQLGVRARTHFVGHRDDVWDILAELDLFLLTSDHEGLSNAVLEAMAAGVPVVSTAVSGAAETLDPVDGVVPGAIVTGDAAAIANEVGRILGDPTLRASMALAARRRAADRFAKERMVDAWEAVLFGPLPARGSDA